MNKVNNMKIVILVAISIITILGCTISFADPAVGQASQRQCTMAVPSTDQQPFLGGGSHRNKILIYVESDADQTSRELSTRGEFLLNSGNVKAAIASYKEALTYSPYDGLAYRRLAEAYIVGGQMNEASQAFHKVLVEGFGPGRGNSIGDVADVWAEYAIVLVKTNQTAEAIQAYNHAASLLDYEDSQYNGGKPYLKVLLPEIVMERTLPDQVRYTPERLQALADAALAYEEYSFGSDKEAVAHMQEAVKLYPDSPVTNYYLGEALLGTDNAGAKAAYQKAVELGDDATVAAAKERIEIFR